MWAIYPWYELAYFLRPLTFGFVFNFDAWTLWHKKPFCMFLAKNDRLQIVNSLKTLNLLIYVVRRFIWRVVFFQVCKVPLFSLIVSTNSYVLLAHKSRSKNWLFDLRISNNSKHLKLQPTYQSSRWMDFVFVKAKMSLILGNSYRIFPFSSRIIFNLLEIDWNDKMSIKCSMQIIVLTTIF